MKLTSPIFDHWVQRPDLMVDILHAIRDFLECNQFQIQKFNNRKILQFLIWNFIGHHQLLQCFLLAEKCKSKENIEVNENVQIFVKRKHNECIIIRQLN